MSRQRTPSDRVHLLIALSAAMLVAGCGAGPAGSAAGAGTPAAGATPAAAGDPQLVARYGFGPQPDPSVTYQPDVVIVGGGPAAIRGVSEDGLTWTIDAGADGVAQLTEGAVMFATSNALGRVVRLERRSDAVDVTLAPVEVGEVIRDAHLKIDQVLPIEALSFTEMPRLAEGFEDVPSDELTSVAPSGGAAFTSAASSGHAPFDIGVPRPGPALARVDHEVAGRTSLAAPAEKSTKLGDWTMSAYSTGSTLGLRAERGIGSAKPIQGADLKVAIDAHIEVDGLRVVADIPITRGEVGSGHFRVFGIKGLNISVQAGAVNGLSDNRSAKFEVPVELRQPLIIGGFPATLTQKFRFLVQTAFTAKNGNLTASGSWDVDGSIGMDGQTVTLPSLTARGLKLIDSLAGVSVGVNGIVVAVSFQFGLQFGLPIASAGPVAAFITSLGMTNGSSLGIVQCKQVSITSVVTAGVGLSVFDPVKTALKKVLNYDVPTGTTLLTKNILDEKWVKPDVVACR